RLGWLRWTATAAIVRRTCSASKEQSLPHRIYRISFTAQRSRLTMATAVLTPHPVRGHEFARTTASVVPLYGMHCRLGVALRDSASPHPPGRPRTANRHLRGGGRRYAGRLEGRAAADHRGMHAH